MGRSVFQCKEQKRQNFYRELFTTKRLVIETVIEVKLVVMGDKEGSV